MDESEIQDLKNENAYLRRTLAECKQKYNDALDDHGRINRLVLRLSNVMVGEGDAMRFDPARREEYREAVRDLVEFWRKGKGR